MTCAEAQAFADAFKPLVADLPPEREVVLGTKLKVNEKVLLYIDPHAHLGKGLDDTVKSTFAYEAGTELQVYKDLYLRVGTFKNIAHPDLREKSNGFGYGIGWVAPRMSFDFAIERAEERLRRRAARLHPHDPQGTRWRHR